MRCLSRHNLRKRLDNFRVKTELIKLVFFASILGFSRIGLTLIAHELDQVGLEYFFTFGDFILISRSLDHAIAIKEEHPLIHVEILDVEN